MGTPQRPTHRKLSTLLIIVGLVLIGIAAFMWFSKQWEYHEQDAENEKLATYAQFPEGDDQPPTVDWAGLKAINPEIVGWIYIPNTAINYPVYQAADNEKYLRHNAEGEYAVGGQVFMDYANTKPGMVDQQTLIYGHHLRNGAMFKHIADMDNQSTFDNTPTVWYLTEDKNFELEPLFLYYTNGDDTEVRELQMESDDVFREYLLGRLTNAVTRRDDAEQIIASTSHALSLITCNYYQDNGRTVLVCVPKDEAQQSGVPAAADAYDSSGSASSGDATN